MERFSDVENPIFTMSIPIPWLCVIKFFFCFHTVNSDSNCRELRSVLHFHITQITSISNSIIYTALYSEFIGCLRHITCLVIFLHKWGQLFIFTEVKVSNFQLLNYSSSSVSSSFFGSKVFSPKRVLLLWSAKNNSVSFGHLIYLYRHKTLF